MGPMEQVGQVGPARPREQLGRIEQAGSSSGASKWWKDNYIDPIDTIRPRTCDQQEYY